MSLIRMVYASRKTEAFNHGELARLMQVSIRNNLAQNITGLLLAGEQCCLQCLEGPRKDVNRLYQKIMMDQRHHDLEILDMREIELRYFSQWPMKLKYTPSLTNALAPQPSFDPYALDAASVDALLRQMRAVSEQHAHIETAPLKIKAARGFFSWI